MVVLRLDTMFLFFFKQKTAYELRISDWSSDVCSSDLGPTARLVSTGHAAQPATCGGDEPPVEPVGGACLVGAWTGGPWVVPAGDTSGGNGVRLDRQRVV